MNWRGLLLVATAMTVSACAAKQAGKAPLKKPIICGDVQLRRCWVVEDGNICAASTTPGREIFRVVVENTPLATALANCQKQMAEMGPGPAP